jgi:uncharacterized protein involved in exopolysaccharide biosynthesis
MSKKNKTTDAAPVNPIQELESLKTQRAEVETQIKGFVDSYKAAQVQKKEIQDRIKSLYSAITESRKAEKLERTNAKIAALQEKLSALTGTSV